MANANWSRWVFSSVNFYLKSVAAANNLAALTEHFDDRNSSFMEAANRVEIRINGPFSKELSKGYFRLLVDVNVELTSRYDDTQAMDIIKYAGIFQEAMDQPIPVFNYGSEVGDYIIGNESTRVQLGCLRPRDEKGQSVEIHHFGQVDKTDKIKQSYVDCAYEMFINY